MVQRYAYWANDYTGGGEGALDKISKAKLNDRDMAIIVSSTGTVGIPEINMYWLDEDSGSAESKPTVIAPDDDTTGKRWLQIFAADQDLTKDSTGVVFADMVATGTINAETALVVGSTGAATANEMIKIGASGSAWWIDTDNPGQLKKYGIMTFSVDPGDTAASTIMNFLIDGSNAMEIDENLYVKVPNNLVVGSTGTANEALEVTGMLRLDGDSFSRIRNFTSATGGREILMVSAKTSSTDSAHIIMYGDADTGPVPGGFRLFTANTERFTVGTTGNAFLNGTLMVGSTGAASTPLEINGTVTIDDGGSLLLQEDITFGGATTENIINVPTNLADALSVKDTAEALLTIISSTGAKAVQIHKTLRLSTVADAGADVDKFLALDGSDNVDYRTGDEMNADINVTPHTGWPTSPGVTLSFVNGTRTFTVTDGGSAYYYIKGVKYTLGGNKTVVITDTEGLWYIYFTGSTLTASQTKWNFEAEDKAMVASLYWNAANNEILDSPGYELHNFIMDGATHHRFHDGGGTAWEEGLLVSDAGSELINVSGGDLLDEDIEVEVSDSTGGGLWQQVLSPAEIPIYYLDGSTLWRIFGTDDKAIVTDVGYVDGSNDLKYNELNGTWSTTTVGTGSHMAMFIIASPNQTSPIAAIMGQRVDVTLANAKENNIFSGLVLTNLPFEEMIVIARVIIKDTGSSPYYSIEDIVDLRNTNQTGNITSPLITDHGGLSGLGDPDHAAYILHSLADAENDFLVASGADAFVKKTLAETGAILEADIDHGNIQGLADVGDHNWSATKTTAAWSKSIGSGGDYADWATMIAAMPDLIAHAVTVTILAGTTLTEICELKNKHGITKAGEITIQAEKYFPASGDIPTADSATATTLRDAALATASLGDDYFNECWIFIVDGTGTDNGYVLITDYDDGNGDVVVASWPGTQPDNTSRYIIVGALIDSGGVRNVGLDFLNNSVFVKIYGIGHEDATLYCALIVEGFKTEIYYCGFYNSAQTGIVGTRNKNLYIRYCGVVLCNTSNHVNHGGISSESDLVMYVQNCGISDNNMRGIYVKNHTFGWINANFGDGNGDWGTYAIRSAQAFLLGSECSGSSGNHSDEGTADTAADDQAAAYT